jgi:hypothetical protein
MMSDHKALQQARSLPDADLCDARLGRPAGGRYAYRLVMTAWPERLDVIRVTTPPSSGSATGRTWPTGWPTGPAPRQGWAYSMIVRFA